MKLHIALYLALHIYAVLISDVSSESQSSWTILEDENGNREVVDLSISPEDSKQTLEELKENVHFDLFTTSNPNKEEQIFIGDDETLLASHFNASNPTRIVIHGWQSSVNGLISTLIRDAYLSIGDRNVIIVDWSSYASKDYFTARTKIVAVGEYVGLLINYLGAFGVDPKDLIIIGHSLGAHVSGIAGRSALSDVGVIIALDPAGPLFYVVDQYARIKSTDASFIQVIHTSAGFLGHLWNLGDVDIWVNGGSSQPGCGLDLLKTCAHQRAYRYFAETIRKFDQPFIARFCATDVDFNGGSCDSNNSTHIGGTTIDTEARGVYHLNTNSDSPYVIS